MRYAKSLLLYQDVPAYGPILRLIIVIVPGGMLAGSIYLWFSGDTPASLALLVEAFVIGCIFWLVFPRRYQVYEDHLRIVMGGPFSVKVGFDSVKTIAVTSRQHFGVNFVTKFTRSYVELAKKRGMSIAITPGDNELFVENANRALSQWLKTNGTVEPTSQQTG